MLTSHPGFKNHLPFGRRSPFFVDMPAFVDALCDVEHDHDIAHSGRRAILLDVKEVPPPPLHMHCQLFTFSSMLLDRTFCEFQNAMCGDSLGDKLYCMDCFRSTYVIDRLTKQLTVILQTDGSVEIRADIPGVSKEEINVRSLPCSMLLWHVLKKPIRGFDRPAQSGTLLSCCHGFILYSMSECMR